MAEPVKPAILLVSSDPGRRSRAAEPLEVRYGADYEVICDASTEEALATCSRLLADEVPVALVIVEQGSAPDQASRLLGEVRDLLPDARRLLLVGLQPAAPGGGSEALRRALTLGDVEQVADEPLERSDERFHQVVTELLAERAEQTGPAVELIRVVGDPIAPRSHEIRDLLTRNQLPFGFYDAGSGAGEELLREAGARGARLPVLLLHDGRALSDPTNEEAAQALGAAGDLAEERFDVTIVGGGPAGLAAAVQASSEGLRTLLVEREALGGQAGTSSLIRNYLGFPRGLSGGALAKRACEQAQRFGARFQLGVEANAVVPGARRHTVVLSDGYRVATRAVILATGVTYRRPDADGLERLTGVGVFYGSAISEAPAVSGEHVFVLGGGNSAGQAAVHLSRYAARVTVLVRGEGVAASMSEYLIAEMDRADNIDVRTRTEVAACHGERRLTHLTLRNRERGSTETVAAAALFVLIGGTPHTDWLPAEIARDGQGYVLTGRDAEGADPERGPIRDFETTVRGVFAVGDVRAGSVKRVASAAGDSTMCVPSVHEYLDAIPSEAAEEAPSAVS